MTIIDANVILRYLLNDDDEMSGQARKAIMDGAYATTEVLAEVVYMLKGVYHAERAEIQEWLSILLDEVLLENKQSILYALKVYAQTSLNFVDCLLIGYNRVLGWRVLTFDKKLKRILADG